MANDMQDDLRKMIERLINENKGPKRIGRPINRKGVTDPRPTETEKSGRRRRPRPMPMPKGPKDDGPKPRPMPMPKGPSRRIKPRPMPKAPGLPRKPRRGI